MKRPGNGYLFDEDDIGNSDSIKEGIEVLLSKELLIQSAGVVQFHRGDRDLRFAENLHPTPMK